ncbi:hypothetical protein PIB30_011942 [Stylosanthes scabra]|uniref:Uncharacterized protein n=1 Tax=Stylosanthes scabra TaxID=79078 RepID=A0ABU6W5F5_9FABA|nr:hypothetical protein [Stylosanthes scabra]
MESLETGQRVWVVTDQNIFGFRVENLVKNDARDLLPFDFHLNLPKRGLRPFIFHSELFFAGGCPFHSSPHSSNKIYQLSYAGGTTLDIAEVEEAGTIPEPPTLLYDCYVANIKGDVHLLVHDDMTQDRKLGFWVLRSGSKQWHLLPLPPTLRNYGVDPDKDAGWGSVRYRPWHSFIWKDKLFLMAQRNPAEGKFTIDDGLYNVFYVYDPQNDPKNDPWQQIERPFPFIDREYYPDMTAVPSLGDVGNCNVALTWSTEDLPSELDCLLQVKIHALLLDNQDNCVRHQCLDELSEAIPSVVFHSEVDVNFVDLGKGKVCILIGGFTLDCKIPAHILCMLVLKLGFVQKEEEGQRFLSVDVIVNQVYDMNPYIEKNDSEVPQSSFVFSLLDLGKRMPLKHSYSQDSNSPRPRKEPKPASCTLGISSTSKKQPKLAIRTNPMRRNCYNLWIPNFRMDHSCNHLRLR